MSDLDLIPLAEALGRSRVLCVGDVMVDHFVYGRVERVSPEAPIPVLRVEREEGSLGGAGNVLRNLHALGAHARFVSAIGNDTAGREVTRLIGALGGVDAHILTERGRTTTVKTRYVAGTQQMLRADREQVAPLNDVSRRKFLDLVRKVSPDCQATVVSDYAKGVLSNGVAAEVIATARAAGNIVVVDPKGTDYSAYRGATVLKPNRRELGDATKRRIESENEIIGAARALIDDFDFAAVLVSLGQDGILLVEARGETHRLGAEAREVYDVSGAGDTVVAVLAAALAAGASFRDAARLANVAAGVVVGKVGTAVVHANELAETLVDRDTLESRKVLPLALALDHVARWRRNGLRIGFTNGCFDLLHPGHVALLSQARTACDRLVVGINSDASVRRLKGAGRPVQNETARAAVLASLASVDLVIVFEEDTPRTLIVEIRPDVLVKGADYRLDQVVGADIVQSYGGKVLLADLLPGHSTTATIARLAR
ncbi:MAG TPA: D-glycero-beta-D-manno-heptose-7-phosphate kinase [Stellaceae bacterium]|nr:D-glycero-beta-D-manno-heptose-7-phosphate kinase [Stellaceae bacterium]